MLRPGGLFVIVSNRRGVDDPAGAALEAVLAPRRPAAEAGTSSPAALFARSGLFDDLGETVVPHVHELDRAEVIELALSMSYIASTDEALRAEVVAEVEAFLPPSGPVPIGYQAKVDLYRRRG